MRRCERRKIHTYSLTRSSEPVRTMFPGLDSAFPRPPDPPPHRSPSLSTCFSCPPTDLNPPIPPHHGQNIFPDLRYRGVVGDRGDGGKPRALDADSPSLHAPAQPTYRSGACLSAALAHAIVVRVAKVIYDFGSMCSHGAHTPGSLFPLTHRRKTGFSTGRSSSIA